MAQQYGCRNCGKKRRPKRKPYGGQRVQTWCKCDRDKCPSVSKKAERQKAKKEASE